ncbi:hypothetical protein Ae168Ps1_1496 [Pseudonocardia sp. Ae168_Ps1]|uniref:hypothetical protein n=1 Tax=unclassified Pseudonocardia TaxID=2619320 RepID=UPI0001FFE75D|nr:MULTISPECIES: hypothetical protein [unclassified Pseudonocardia]OLL79090.1 hypothetical protein Ae168Ps1_1496 [Pseudonocardia sp. Ae168_Ps1]OLL86772.1 hypothetical protein Ae263Ps1_3827c [Pseudonocardia sp. Ae263_Ps1]OLL93184.1 hypothetical protein Ae356Ps1_3081 [Pseudonocardia sp. Ae356_Ps1]OLM19650.1 hypothetical protein Ae707Ps1_3909 [Pseudonocardia sp. Ae707_Ps1]
MPDALTPAEFHETVGRTVAAGPARITLHMDFSRNREAVEEGPRRRGILPALARAVVRRLPRELDAEGVLDVAGRRAMFDQGHMAAVQLGDRVWSGRPGRTLDSLPSGTAPELVTPLRLFDRLATVTAVEDRGPDDGLRHVTATTDGSPEPVEVWLDTHVRRIRAGRDATTMTLDAFGTDVDGLDWTRLPGSPDGPGTT